MAASPVGDAAALPLGAGVVVFGVELRAGQPLAAAEVAPVGVGARVLAGAVPVVQQALVLVRAERTLKGDSLLPEQFTESFSYQ